MEGLAGRGDRPTNDRPAEHTNTQLAYGGRGQPDLYAQVELQRRNARYEMMVARAREAR